MLLKQYCEKVSDSNISIKEAITCTEIQISQINRENPVQFTALIISFIKDMLLYFGKTTEDMTREQLEGVVKDILHNFYYFHIEDVCLCFKRARTKSNYDKFYGAVDGKIILKWFSIYDKERDEIIQSLPQQPKVKYTGNEVGLTERIENLEAMIAGGDLYANKELRNVFPLSSLYNKGEYAKYKYDRKHKYDNRR